MYPTLTPVSSCRNWVLGARHAHVVVFAVDCLVLTFGPWVHDTR